MPAIVEFPTVVQEPLTQYGDLFAKDNSSQVELTQANEASQPTD